MDSPGRTCGTGGSCGRPFLVEGKARLPEVVRRDTGWSTETSPHVAALDPATRRELAEHYAHLGVMEHASVAAFARFTLELLSLGAPATLVADAQRALGDEIRHAEACFGLASAYAGETLGPGPLSCEGALEHAGSFEAIVETAFAEACIGETLAAVEAAEAAEHATDPVVRRVLLGIAEDERRHAELGWRFVTWALEHSRGVERARLERRLADIVARSRNETLDGSSARNDASVLLAHGKLTAELRVEARRAAFDELVTPLSQGIFQARAA